MKAMKELVLNYINDLMVTIADNSTIDNVVENQENLRELRQIKRAIEKEVY